MVESKNKSDKREIIGKVSATERDPTSSEDFSFWLASGEIVNPFDIIEAEQMEETRTFGLVTDIRQITDAPSHLSNFISSDFGSTEGEAQTPRQGANVASVNVLANFDPSEPRRFPMGIYMPVQNDSAVRFADEAGIQVALGIDKMAEEHRIPAGLIRMSNGTCAGSSWIPDMSLGPKGPM